MPITDGFRNGTTLADLVSATYYGMSEEFQARIPAETLNDIAEFGHALSLYEAGQNDFVYSLINHIGRVNVNYKMFNNPLAMFKKGKLEYGDTIEDVYVDVIKGMMYEPEVPNDNAGDVWETFKPNIDVIYHKINKALVYPVTINELVLKRAFRSYKELDKFLSGIMRQLYNADEIDDFYLTTKLLGMYGDVDGSNKYYQVQVDPVVDGDDGASAKALITKIRAMVAGLRFPSRRFNAQGVMNNASPEELYLLVTPALTAIVDVNVLASAFNMDKTTFVGNVVEVPDFGGLEDCVALLVDKEFMQIYDTEIRMATTGLNARHLTTNYYFHHQGIFSLSPYYTAIEFTTAEIATPTQVVITAPTSITKGDTKTLTASVQDAEDAEAGATQTVVWEVVGAPQYVTINQNGNLTVGSKFAGSSITVKAVSAEDSTLSATKTISVL